MDATHDFHEVASRAIAIGGIGRHAHDGTGSLVSSGPAVTRRSHVRQMRRSKMAWTKPAAVDMRYGFEINLYVAAR
jgi:coenzyme PQQ precursor peptide PqqA|nr:pyrroloquinoline quinone precursor peptide PqqA [Panacagrimonas sp.]